MNYLKKKRLALMKNKQFRGYVKTVSGYPLTLTNCMENGLINLTIYGNSVQNGTPTPQNPIEVQSAGDYDEATQKYKITIKINDDIINIYQDNPLYYLEATSGREAVYNNIVIDYKNRKAKLENTIAYLTITGEESGWYDTGEKNGLNRYIIPGKSIGIPAGDGAGYTQMISNYYSGAGRNFGQYIKNTCGAYIDSASNLIAWIGFCVSVDEFPDVQSFKDWVHDKYINNNQLYVLINTGTVQVTDISSDIDWSLIPNLKKGTNIISAETVLEPSNMEASYYSDIQED